MCIYICMYIDRVNPLLCSYSNITFTFPLIRTVGASGRDARAGSAPYSQDIKKKKKKGKYSHNSRYPPPCRIHSPPVSYSQSAQLSEAHQQVRLL